jgi:hypothetical protein
MPFIMRSQYLVLVFILCLLLFATGRSAHAEYAGFADPGARSAAGGNPTGGLVPVNEEVDGGKLPIGATAQVVVRFRNDGSQPVETGLIRLYPSSTVSASIALNQCEEAPLAAGAECAIALSVKGLQAGPWRLEMLMSHSGRTRLVTSTLSGSVETTGDSTDKMTSDIQTIPDEVDFGSLSASQTLTMPVTLRNITSMPIDMSDIYIDSSAQSGYTLKTDCKKLSAGQTCIAVITWAPQLKGRSSGVLVIKHSGPAALSSVPLKGEYSPEVTTQAELFPQAVPGKGLLVASQTLIDFGADVGTASAMTVSLVNAGDADLKIKEIKISGADNGVSYKENGCAADTVLAPIEACPLTVTWSPTRVGAVFDDIQVVHDGARGVLVLPIRGTAVSTVSQDQKTIDLSGGVTVLDPSQPPSPPGVVDASSHKREPAPQVNAASLLDGYKITSFSPRRAIINGPGGSRIVFDNEEIVLGGVPWFVVIQKNGIEFLNQGQRILLLFDRSLSSINRISASSDSEGSSTSSGASTGTTAPAAATTTETTSAGTNG